MGDLIVFEQLWEKLCARLDFEQASHAEHFQGTDVGGGSSVQHVASHISWQTAVCPCLSAQDQLCD